MGWKMTFGMIVFFFILVFGMTFIFQTFGTSNTPLVLSDSNNDRTNDINYGDIPMFAENLRFSRNDISYSIDNSCDLNRKATMVSAFNIFSSRTGVISFYEVATDGNIKIFCSDDYIDLGNNLFAAGEGGPSRIINTSGFKVIEEGQIVLYEEEKCDYPVVELHELCHVFGFDHSENPNSIMYNTSDCDMRMDANMDRVIRKLYSIEGLPDAAIESVTANVHGRYLDFNISILNEGLTDLGNVTLVIYADEKEVDSFPLGELSIGFGRQLRAENVVIGGGFDEVKFFLDSDEIELNEENNVVVMTV